MSFMINMLLKTDGWLFFGLFAQFMFFLRFVVQWWFSEKKKESYLPIHFWYLSIAGGIMILVYSIHIGDIVFIVGQFLALLIYFRNLHLLLKSKH